MYFLSDKSIVFIVRRESAWPRGALGSNQFCSYNGVVTKRKTEKKTDFSRKKKMYKNGSICVHVCAGKTKRKSISIPVR